MEKQGAPAKSCDSNNFHQFIFVTLFSSTPLKSLPFLPSAFLDLPPPAVGEFFAPISALLPRWPWKRYWIAEVRRSSEGAPAALFSFSVSGAQAETRVARTRRRKSDNKGIGRGAERARAKFDLRCALGLFYGFVPLIPTRAVSLPDRPLVGPWLYWKIRPG